MALVPDRVGPVFVAERVGDVLGDITLAEDGITTWRDYTDGRRLAEQLELGGYA